ncbi:hypothetical protein ACQPX6_12875 [Actinomycetospora sp. CA-101289]|uniref:hypothetical protein n=1 Tax=Actinomycetospora sp. CA-101289 TaxID=3239893 RepID=UPI003D97F665
MAASTHDPDHALSPEDSLALIDAQRRTTQRRLRPHPLALFLPWGLVYVVAFGAVWLTLGPGLLPAPATVVVVALAVVGAVATMLTALVRSHHGVEGPTRRVATRYGGSWALAFATLGVVNSQLIGLGVAPTTISLIWSSSALIVVGLLTLAGGLLWPGSGQYVLGVWILVSAALSIIVGYPTNFLVLSLAGGGGFVVLALVAWARGRQT